ncbi:Ferredoxin--NADP reductase 2 [Candidatus Cyrtobacter comes]|uniref:Ferredoxin--NADP reductase n=1 Tax=Candidatus Cyrtobacter comes TaxID=675776 RepID=A0ABU5L9N0_9RICK|nr:NAD(P)/FAD-dependent oxidoreductase [Candidatus Cyrtobacter comes]MDZ5762580.1 Ferredoxin--NADP reductase 2 [Candidatus Cyrtobacter comes]
MFDVVIIGAGPVGLFCAFESGMLNMKTALIEALPEIGGQCAALYPQKPIYDIPAHPMLLAEELVSNLKKQIAPFHHEIILNTKVNYLSKKEDFFLLRSECNKEIRTRTVIIAAGGGSLIPNRPPLDHIKLFEEYGSILYSINSLEKFKDKIVVIAGGGDSAVDFAILLSKVARKIYVIHRRNRFRALDASITQMNGCERIETIIPFQLERINGHNGMMDSVIIKNIENDQLIELKTDFLIPCFGLSMDLGPIQDWGFEMNGKYIKVDNSNMMTSTLGVFAIGDVATYHGKLKFILTGFAEGALACHSAYSIVNPGLKLHFEHSTSKGIPIE